MTLLVIAVLVALVAAALVVHPLLAGRSGLLNDLVPGGVIDRESRKRVALAALKEVEYDHAAGKLDDADYREMRGRLELEALTAVKAAEAETLNAVIRHTCGFENPGGSRFCAGCGERLG